MSDEGKRPEGFDVPKIRAARRPVKKTEPEHPVVKKVEMKGKITARSLNVRNEPYLDADIVGKVVKNQEVKIIGQLTDWYKIQLGELYAFVYAKYVQLIFVEGVITARILNVRAEPSGSAEIVTKVNKSDKVKVVEKTTNGWYAIMLKNNNFAYVYAKYVSLIETPVTHKYLYQIQELLDAPLEPRKQLDVSGTTTEKSVRRIWNKYGNLMQLMSKKLGIDTATAIAVMAVESGGEGFRDGRMLIRFENHLFYRFWGKNEESTFNKHFKFDSRRKWEGHYFRRKSLSSWKPLHKSQKDDWEALEFARTLNDQAAIYSASYGLPQILGFNHKKIGYPTHTEMFDNFSKDVRFHIIGLFDFFDSKMTNDLKKKDFVSFAKSYNGKGQADRYGSFIKNAYRAFPK